MTDIMGYQAALDGELSEAKRATLAQKLAKASERAKQIDTFIKGAREALGAV